MTPQPARYIVVPLAKGFHIYDRRERKGKHAPYFLNDWNHVNIFINGEAYEVHNEAPK